MSILQSSFIGVQEKIGESVSALSAGAHTTILLVMVDRVKGGVCVPPPSPGWTDFTIMMECTSTLESGHSHSVYSVKVSPLLSWKSWLYCTSLYLQLTIEPRFLRVLLLFEFLKCGTFRTFWTFSGNIYFLYVCMWVIGGLGGGKWVCQQSYLYSFLLAGNPTSQMHLFFQENIIIIPSASLAQYFFT